MLCFFNPLKIKCEHLYRFIGLTNALQTLYNMLSIDAGIRMKTVFTLIVQWRNAECGLTFVRNFRLIFHSFSPLTLANACLSRDFIQSALEWTQIS